MKNLLLVSTVVLGIWACDPPNDPPPFNAPIVINGTEWEIENSYAHLAKGGLAWSRTYLKLDGVDGGCLLILTPFIPDSTYAIPYSTDAEFEFYVGSAWNAAVFKGTGTLNVAAQDETNHTLNVTFDVTVSNGSGNSLTIQSEDGVNDIPYSDINLAPVNLQMAAQSNGAEWWISEPGTDMLVGGVSWDMLNRVLNPEEKIEIQIPWNLSIGKHTIAPADLRAVRFYNGNPLMEWITESAELEIKENSFENGFQKGVFKGVFHHPTMTDQKAVFEGGTFEVSYK